MSLEQENNISDKDFKNLKKNKYFDKKKYFSQSFVIFNVKTKAIAEIRANSSFHACKMIGWRPQNVVLIK